MKKGEQQKKEEVLNITLHQKSANFKLEKSKQQISITSYGGLPLIRQAMESLGLRDEMKKFMLKRAGYSDELIIEAIILLLSSGGQSLSDWEYLGKESGFEKLFGLCPSVDTLERYLKRLKILMPERKSDRGKVGYTLLLDRLHVQMIKKAYELAGRPAELTIDIDSQLLETNKSDALYCYEKYKAYQPMIAYCPELRIIMAHEFRDGNVSPAEGYFRMVKRCRQIFPNVKFTVRTDAAGYQNNFIDWMTRNRIIYYITAKQTKGMALRIGYMKEDDWKTFVKLDGFVTDQQVSELNHGPSFSAQRQLHIRVRRRKYVITRRRKDQIDLFEPYTYQVIVTNVLEESFAETIAKHHGRCGSVEYANSQLKGQCGMKIMPSNDFAVNAAWYSLGCLTHNLLRCIQDNILPKSFKKIEIETLRYRLIRCAAWVIEKGRQIIVRLDRYNPLYEIFHKARLKLSMI